MKVMIINSLYYPNIIGGAERSTQFIAENLKMFNIEPVVVTVSDEDRIEYVKGIKVYYVRHFNVYWSYYSKTKNNMLKTLWHIQSLYNFRILKSVERIIKSEKPDVVHTNNLSEFTVGIWKVIKNNRIPLLHTLRDFSLLCIRATLFKRNDLCRRKNIFCYLMMRFRRFFSNLPDAVSGNSNFILEEHKKSGFFRNSKKYVVYNSLHSENIESRRIKKGRLSFGYIGQLSFHKGVETVLDVFFNSIDADLDIFGKGITPDYEEELKKRFSSNSIRFHGFIETDNAFKAIDVLIVPSLCLDSLPRVIYEAYSYGVPVIVSDRGGGNEIVDSGKTGFIYMADSKDDLIKKINLFRSNPEMVSEMGKECLLKAEDFLPNRSIVKYVKIYMDIAKQQISI